MKYLLRCSLNILCFLFYALILLTFYNLTHIGTSKANFNCLYNPLTTIHLPYGLTLTSPVSEKGPLLSSRGEMGYYKLHTQGPLHSSGSGTQQLISALTFIPQISIHKAAVFKCQVSYIGKDKIMVERVSEKFSILCKKVFSLYFSMIFTISAIEFFVYFLSQLLLKYQRSSWQRHQMIRVRQ